jgi:hypothetical protein
MRTFVAAADAADSAGQIALDGAYDGGVVPEIAEELLSEVLHEAPLGTGEPTIPTILTIVLRSGPAVGSDGPGRRDHTDHTDHSAPEWS